MKMYFYQPNTHNAVNTLKCCKIYILNIDIYNKSY